MIRVFVYGTLKNGKGEVAWIHGDLYDLGHFPGVRNAGKSMNWVKGEIHLVTKNDLRRLDIHEGTPNLYIRKAIGTFDENRKPMDLNAWVYEYNHQPPDIARCGEEWN